MCRGAAKAPLDHEILWEPGDVAPDLLVEALGGDAIEGGQVRIQDHALATQYG